MQSDILDVYLIQFSPELENREATLKRLEALISTSVNQKYCHSEQREEPKIKNQKLVVLPEMFSTGFKLNKEASEPMHGETMQWMKTTAQSLNVAIYGSLLIFDENKLYNRGLFVYPNGEYTAYDKRHCFVMSDEPKYITAGKEIVTVEYGGWRLRLNICHDLRFPVWSRNIYKDGHYEYDILLNIASWADSRAHVWRTLLHARAIENLAYCIGVNRVGTDGDGYNYRGDSMVVDAKGTALAVANPNEEHVVAVQLNKSALNDFREKLNIGSVWDSYEMAL